jgi:tetraacyldisaccharide 4'-kinase
MLLNKPKFWDYSDLSFWSIVMYPFSLIFLLASLISKSLKTQKKFPIPIICVGNIYVGGTGKTPLASEVFNILKSNKKNPGFIKKNYKYLYDEITMLKKTGKIFPNKNRIKAIRSLISSGCDVAILDDGFQDYSIKKNFSVLCFNSKQLIGNGFIIPSGPLRESFQSIKRADCVVINGNKNLEFENKIKEIDKNIKIFYSKYTIKNLDQFKNKKVLAFAGIGNPSNFFELLKENNIDLKRMYSFPDHHNYSERDYNYLIKDKSIYTDLKNEHEVLIVTTEKDYSRINDKMKHNFICVEVNLEIENKNEFINLILSKL